MTDPVLQLAGISKRFGGVQALQDVDLVGRAGEVHGLIGPNGAGKSTLISCITGVNRIDSGQIHLRGQRIDALPVHSRARLGIARTFQKIRLMQQLTVFENVAAGLSAKRFGRASGWLGVLAPLSSAAITGPVERALEVAGIADLADVKVDSLPYGKRHFVELARNLVAQPDVVLLDEPATGLTDDERQRFSALVCQMAQQGTLVLLVEHDLDLVGRLCDTVTVIEYGRRIFDGTPAEAQDNEAVVRAYLGSARLAQENQP